jgi:hypothetical protein
MTELHRLFGPAFDGLTQLERIALALALSEGTVTHARLRMLSTEHPVDVSKALQHLVQEGLLASTGGRGAIYHIEGMPLPTPDDVFGPPPPLKAAPSSPDLPIPSSPDLATSSPDLKSRSRDLPTKRDPNGCLTTDQLHLPVVDNLAELREKYRWGLELLASGPRKKRKLPREELIAVILQLCSGRFITLGCLAELVSRNPDNLRDQYLSPLVKEQKLELAFPTTPNHMRQAYCATAVWQKPKT